MSIEAKFTPEDMNFIGLEKDDEFMLLMSYINIDGRTFDVSIDGKDELSDIIINYTDSIINKGENNDFKFVEIMYPDISEVQDPFLFSVHVYYRKNEDVYIAIKLEYGIIFDLVKSYLDEYLNV